MFISTRRTKKWNVTFFYKLWLYAQNLGIVKKAKKLILAIDFSAVWAFPQRIICGELIVEANCFRLQYPMDTAGSIQNPERKIFFAIGALKNGDRTNYTTQSDLTFAILFFSLLTALYYSYIIW